MISREAIWRKKRYAEDPEFRRTLLAYNRSWRAAHKDEVNTRRAQKNMDPENRDRLRAQYICRYGLSLDDYTAMLARQGGACAICKKKTDRVLAIDHCHSTGKVRGLLCFKCNSGLGLYGDDPDLMRAAAAYLEAARGGEPA